MTASGVGDEYARVLRRTTALVMDAYGQPGRPRPSGERDPGLGRDAELALVELVAAELRCLDRRPGGFLERPAHLPDEDELPALLDSRAAKDQGLRADLVEWSEINRRVARANADKLRVPALAFLGAVAIMVDEEHCAEARAEATRWAEEIADHVRRFWGADLAACPADRALVDAWCLSVCEESDPTPSCLRGGTTASRSIRGKEIRRARSIERAERRGEHDDE